MREHDGAPGASVCGVTATRTSRGRNPSFLRVNKQRPYEGQGQSGVEPACGRQAAALQKKDPTLRKRAWGTPKGIDSRTRWGSPRRYAA